MLLFLFILFLNRGCRKIILMLLLGSNLYRRGQRLMEIIVKK